MNRRGFFGRLLGAAAGVLGLGAANPSAGVPMLRQGVMEYKGFTLAACQTLGYEKVPVFDGDSYPHTWETLHVRGVCPCPDGDVSAIRHRLMQPQGNVIPMTADVVQIAGTRSVLVELRLMADVREGV